MDRRVPVLPFVLTIVLILFDQITKLFVIRNVAINQIGPSIIGEFARIIHVRNLGIAFSIGDSISEGARRVLFILVPACVMIGVVVYYLRSGELTTGMRWALAGILGGGIGNLIDRIFRPLGVVDFMLIKVYGFLGMEHWPVFNVADSSIVVSGISLVLLFLLEERRLRKEISHEQKD